MTSFRKLNFDFYHFHSTLKDCKNLKKYFHLIVIGIIVIYAEDVCTSPTQLVNWFVRYHGSQFENGIYENSIYGFEKIALKIFCTNCVEIIFIIIYYNGHLQI